MSDPRLSLVLVMALWGIADGQAQHPSQTQRIQPWSENPWYWQYRGAPVLLVGGSGDDNLFQWPPGKLAKHLDLMRVTGANYVRNTMSDRPDRGFEVYPFLRLPNGRYDLEQWNPEYWSRFARFLRWTEERDILVQIELWDRFDHSRDHWLVHPFNPANNVNFGFAESGFEPRYPEHPGRNQQPFFFTTPGQRDNRVVLRFQQRFIDRVLSHSLPYGHVLYTIDNETNGEEAWGRYWAGRVKERARQQGVPVYLTQMWDAWDLKSDEHRRTFDHPGLYDFVDVSQNNHNKGQQHWDNALWVRQYLSGHPRPINTVKTYGADGNKFGHSDRDGIERVFRHLLAGFASVRFHRPESGLGLNPSARSAIRAVRRVESLVKLWELTPRPDLVGEREENEAYSAAWPGRSYVVYFPDGGSVSLQARDGRYQLHWIGLDQHRPALGVGVRSGTTQLTAPGSGHWFAVLLLSLD